MKVYNIIILLLLVVGAFFLARWFFYQKTTLKTSAVTIGKVTRVGTNGGSRVGIPEIEYEYKVKDKLYSNYAKIAQDDDFSVGDCIEIKYGASDPRIAEVNLEKGVITCE